MKQDQNLDRNFDVVIVGAGLAGALTSIRLAQLNPSISICLIESQANACGNHTWSCHEHDLLGNDWVRKLLSYSWSSHEVRFQNFTRVIWAPYHSICSEGLRSHLNSYKQVTQLLSTQVIRTMMYGVVLANHSTILGKLIIDASGTPGTQQVGRGGYQKFCGWDFTFKSSHGITHPCLMDAMIDQSEGYQFIYLLPWTEKTCLVEETSYHTSPSLDAAMSLERVSSYLNSRGLEIEKWTRFEQGVLPLPGSAEEMKNIIDSPLQIGSRGGLFHATTGYSLPFAVQVAELIAQKFQYGSAVVENSVREFRTGLTRKNSFYCFLNRMLFQAANPQERFKIFQRFYHLSDPLINRFYSAKTTRFDQFQILSGRPPVRISRAIQEYWNEH